MKGLFAKIPTWSKLTIQAKYFVIAILIVGSIGIWLPLLLSIALGQQINHYEIPINITTFYVSIYFAGCVDYIMNILDNKDEKKQGKSDFLTYLALILVAIFFVVTTVWLKLQDHFIIPLLLALLGTSIALILWWKNNVKNPLFVDVRDKRSEEQEEIMDSLG